MRYGTVWALYIVAGTTFRRGEQMVIDLIDIVLSTLLRKVAATVSLTAALILAAVVVALGLPGTAAAWYAGLPIVLIPTRFFSFLDNFSLRAAPFYIFASEGVNRSGITETLFTFAAKVTRRVSGGAAHANTLASIFFAGISGTAIAHTAALGMIFINGMPKQG